MLRDKASRKGKSNNDIIPFGTKLIQEFKDTVKSDRGKKGQALKANRNSQDCFIYQITRGEIRATYAHLQKIANLSLSNDKTVPYSLQKTITTNYFYDKITSIEYLQRETMMYDLEVDGFHSFTVNGFVCHNSQGSEYPVVMMPLYTQHYLMLNRNLVYTGLTRAKSLAILVGPKKALAIANRQVNDTQRYTRLRKRLI